MCLTVIINCSNLSIQLKHTLKICFRKILILLICRERGGTVIAIRNVTKEFDVNKQKVTALSDVNFTIEKGDIFGIIGFSGAGKSTLLRMINALEVPTSGHVEIDGVNINDLSFNELRKVRKRIGMVFQQFNLLNAKSVYDNVAIPLILNKVPKSEIDRKVKTLLDFVDLAIKQMHILENYLVVKNNALVLLVR